VREKDDEERALTRRADEFQDGDADIVADRKALSDPIDGQPIATSTSLQMRASFFSGPLPRPQLFREYEEICKGAADRILTMSEKEGDHRRALEVKAADSAISTERRAQYFGFSAYVLTTVMGGALLLLGVPAIGITMVIGSLVTLLGAGIWNKYEERKRLQMEERQQKASEKASEAQAEQAKRAAEKKDGKKGKKGK
jgi:uncharacterized membrane protein